MDLKKFGNKLLDSGLLVAGAVGVSLISRKVAKGETLGVPATMNGALKLTLAFALSSVGLTLAKEKGLLKKIGE
jgi:hypothetical protein